MGLKTVFIITILTSRMIMPGMPDLSKLPGGFKLPGVGSPARSLRMNLISDKSVDAESKAECAVPEGLQLGPKVNLQINLPTPEQPAPESKSSTSGEGQKTKWVIKKYWGCAEAVRAGQPKVTDSEQMMGGVSADPARLQKMMEAMAKMGSEPVAESLAHWPGNKAKPIKDDASTPGSFELTTNYCGGTSITLDSAQDFLAPIDVVSPGNGGVDMEKAIDIEWKSVPNARAYVITAFAAREGEMIMWTSSDQPEATAFSTSRALTRGEIKSCIDKGILFLRPRLHAPFPRVYSRIPRLRCSPSSPSAVIEPRRKTVSGPL